jgi:hypothetical protein
MTEQNLNGAQVGSGIQQMSGETMSEDVRVNMLLYAGTTSGVSAQDAQALV